VGVSCFGRSITPAACRLRSPGSTIWGCWPGRISIRPGRFGVHRPRGQFLTIDYREISDQTSVDGINDADVSVGYYLTASDVAHGWIRSPAGTFTQIDDPLAATQTKYRGTVPTNINAAGVISGFYLDSNDVLHGFVERNGTFTTVDAPAAGTASGQGRFVNGINDEGVLTGESIDAHDVAHSLVDRHGRLFALAPPGAGTGQDQGSAGNGISDNDSVLGTLKTASNVEQGWRQDHSRFSPLIDPDAGPAANQGTNAGDISPDGRQVAGCYWDSSGVENGFVAAL
jgi:hypothetical protein